MQAIWKFLRTPRGRAVCFAAWLALLFAAYIGLILVSDAISTDIAFAGTMLPELLEWGYQTFELIAFFTSYAFILYALFEGGLYRGAVYIGIYVLATALRFAVLLLLSFIDLWAVAVNLVPELIQLAVVVLICHRSVAAFDRIWQVRRQGAQSLGQPVSRAAMVYPQKKQPIREDALLRAARGSAICVSAVRVLGRIVFDVTIGPPTDVVDALWMLCYYSVDVLIGVGGYYFIKWLLRVQSRLTAE